MRLHEYSADHRYLLEQVAKEAGFDDPVAFDLSAFRLAVLKRATRGRLCPVDGVMVRDWDPDYRHSSPGVKIGIRLYRLEGVSFALVQYHPHLDLNSNGMEFAAVDRKDYGRFYRLANQARRDRGEAPRPPILEAETLDALWQNTVGYLDRGKLRRIKEYGGQPKRGILLTGPPGNGKTSVCRWLWHECLQRQWDFRMVTPDVFRSARNSPCDPAEEVKNLFKLDKRGIVFFDDMDIALRNRDTVAETEDQAVFLTALDGIEPAEGVVFVFTTNCKLELIDPAFRRPGRIDLALDFPPPSEPLRRRLMDRWHPDLVAGLDPDVVAADTAGYSFAEIEELKNLLILRHMDSGDWDWDWALRQFAFNRRDLARDNGKRVGFGLVEPRNGNGVHPSA